MKAKAQWLLGYPDQALETIHSALALAMKLQHPFGMRQTLLQAAKVHCYRGEANAVLECVKQAKAAGGEQIMRRHEMEGTVLRGWALGQLGQASEVMALVHETCSQRQAEGAHLELPFFFALLAEIYERAGQVEAAQRVIQQAQAIAALTQEDHYLPELHRLYGKYFLTRGDINAAQSSFLLAIETAQAQQAKSHELRATLSLSRLWAEQGQRAEAYDLLNGVYSWFTEGFDTADLRQANELLLGLSP
jgi:predicted ATPase